MGNGVSFERERVHSCEKAVGRVTESVGDEGCSPGGRLVPAGGPSGAKRGRGRNAISAVWPVRNRASVAYALDTL